MYDKNIEDQYYDLAVAGYYYELRRLVSVIETSVFSETLKSFTKKNKLSEMQKRGAYKSCLQDLSSYKGYSMDAGSPCERDYPFYSHVDLAAACAFFDGLTIPFSRLSYDQTDAFSRSLVSQIEGNTREVTMHIADRLNRSDTMRVTMALKLLGLLPAESHRLNQLSLGALYGDRDMKYMHQQPTLAKKVMIEKGAGQGPVSMPAMKFGASSKIAKDIVLVDLDPATSERYAELNRSRQSDVLALNCDVLDALSKLHEEIQRNNKKARDLVMLFRMEPAMLPDVDLFLEKLSKVIENKAKFIVTVGAGHDDEGYRQRKNKMDELASKFVDRDFRVERLKWCHGDTPEEQRANPLMGIGNYSSYDVLYSEIQRDRL